MAQPTTTIKADRDANFVYELNLTSDVKRADIRLGREADNSKTKPGICMLVLDNSGGEYTAKGANTPLRPMHGIQVIADSQNLFTGFVRRTKLHPDGNKQRIRVDCADWLWVLSRTDISLPLMLGVRSDILAHRIADLAEIGELVDNTRFKDDLTGYSDLGAATTTRATTQPMEGPAEARTTGVTGTADGWSYALTNASSGDKVEAVVYVRAYQDADVGTLGSLLLFDDGGQVGDGLAFTLTGDWQRLTTNGTYGSTNPTIRLVGGVASSFATIASGAVHCTLFKNAISRSFDNGVSVFSHIAPRRTNALRAIQEAADNELGGYCYVNGSGTLVFEDRHHRFRETASTVSQGTIDETMVDMPYEEEADDLIGEVELHYRKWEEGDADTPVFSLFPVPRSIPPNGTLTIDGDYGAIVRDFTVPVANTDFFIRSQPDSDTAGDDETGNVTLAFEDFGGGFQAVFTSSVARTVHLTSLKVRATPIRIASDQPQEVYTPSGAPDYASKLKFSYRLASSQRSVAAYAQYLGDRYVTQRERLPVRMLNKTAAILAEMTDRVISERMTITNDNTLYSAKVNGAYYIDSVQHRLSQGKTKMETIWSVVPVDVDMFTWGTSSWGGADVWAP